MHNERNPDSWTSYLDPYVFEQEQQRIFRRATWHYLGLAEDVSEVGRFVTANVGTTPVVLNRGIDGLHAFVNRCAHRGALVVRQPRGQCDKYVCELHRWTYDHAGNLLDGGRDVGLRKLRLDSHHDLVFGTLDEGAPTLRDYLTEAMRRRFDSLCGRSLMALSHHRCSVKANWKLYIERLLVSHGRFGMLPLYQAAARAEYAGQHISWTTDSEKDDAGNYCSILRQVEVDGEGAVPFFFEHGDGTAAIALFVFPAFMLVKVENHLQLRQIVPKSANEFEIAWINYAYADESADHVQVRQAQGSLLGLASPLSFEDARELEAAHKALQSARSGNQAPATPRASCVASWKAYRDAMKTAADLRI